MHFCVSVVLFEICRSVAYVLRRGGGLLPDTTTGGHNQVNQDKKPPGPNLRTVSMRAISSFMLAIFVSLPLSLAQTKMETRQYTVWASAMFLRNGETTPNLLYPQTLTSLGAQQAFAAGSFFRERYVEAGLFSATPKAPIDGLTAELLSPADLYVLALDSQPSVASAQAFLQGLYPPSLPGSNTGGSAVAGALDTNSLLANGTYVRLSTHLKDRSYFG